MKNRHNQFLQSRHNIQEKDNRKKMAEERKLNATNIIEIQYYVLSEMGFYLE